MATTNKDVTIPSGKLSPGHSISWMDPLLFFFFLLCLRNKLDWLAHSNRISSNAIPSHIAVWLEEKTGSASAAENNNKDSSSKSSVTSSTSGEQGRAPPPQSPGLGGASAAAGFPPNPFDFSAMTGLLNVCQFPLHLLIFTLQFFALFSI